ncbi:MAG: hypothetical protein M1457_08805 [bacterium]|nr:hypothetical protein [bacterium]
MKKKASDVGLESQDDPDRMAENLFKNPEILRLLGDKPRFIYNPGGRPDPMLVPWVRDAVIFEELSTIAEGLLAGNKVGEAKQVFQRIIQMNNPRYTMAAQARLAQIMTAEEAAAAAKAGEQQITEEQIQLPPWVQDNTSGVIVSPGGNLCLVGDFLLKVGDCLPNYPEVSVTGITNNTVTYAIRNKHFDVTLENGDSGSFDTSWKR